MPQIVYSIDAIARQKGRDVLQLSYRRSKDGTAKDAQEMVDPFGECDWSENPVREEIINGLEALGIGWLPCASMVGPDTYFDGYWGDIYLDVPFDASDPIYKKLSAFLEDDEEGYCRFPGVVFSYLPLEIAMKYAFNDESEVWE